MQTSTGSHRNLPVRQKQTWMNCKVKRTERIQEKNEESSTFCSSVPPSVVKTLHNNSWRSHRWVLLAESSNTRADVARTHMQACWCSRHTHTRTLLFSEFSKHNLSQFNMLHLHSFNISYNTYLWHHIKHISLNPHLKRLNLIGWGWGHLRTKYYRSFSWTYFSHYLHLDLDHYSVHVLFTQ